MELTEINLALIFKALGDINRIRILEMLRSGETCACKLLDALEISQPTLSHHMKILCDDGIVYLKRYVPFRKIHLSGRPRIELRLGIVCRVDRVDRIVK